MYNRSGYIEIVERLTEKSMQAAVDEVKDLSDYPTNGEVITYSFSDPIGTSCCLI